MEVDERPPGGRSEAATAASRRRLLRAGAGVAVAAGLAGCTGLSPFRDDSFEDYACTDVDDEPAERFEPTDSGLPFSFEKPAPMDRERARRTANGGMVVLEYAWRQPGRQGREQVVHSIQLRVSLSRTGLADKAEYWGGSPPEGVEEVSYGGERNRVVERDSGATASSLVVVVPRVGADGGVYDVLAVTAEAAIAGGEQLARGRPTDPSQTCADAVRNVALATATSIEPL